MDKINYKTLLDFSKGKYSYNDYLTVKSWFLNINNECDMEEQLLDQFNEFSDSPNPKSLHPIFEKVQYHILLEEKRHKQERSLWYYYRQIAAILVPLLVISASLYFFYQPGQMREQTWLEINVPEGARIKFLLPDSTAGWLNGGAKLKYPAEFTQHRKVELTGEAFFNVKHREHSDFVVGVKGMDIKVLGTKFNVSAYENDPFAEVVLKEGRVEIEGTTTPFKQVLYPSEKISYNHQTRSVNKTVVDTSVYIAWTKGYLVIDNEPLFLAARKLERWYNVDISIPDEKIKNFRLKATFQDEPIEEVLRFIAMTTPITCKIDDRNQDLNGILKKKKVIIQSE